MTSINSIDPNRLATDSIDPCSVLHDRLPVGSQRYCGSHVLGRGGWGIVLRSTDKQLDRDVAVKKLVVHAIDNPDLVRRFMHEGAITAQLQHPGIVPIYERGIGHDDGQPFYAMKLLDGVTLEHKIRDYHCLAPGRIKRTLLLELLNGFIDICNAVAYAHQQQIIHRDLKPANVIVGQFGETVVVDWGLAKRIVDAPRQQSEPNSQVNSDATIAAGIPIPETQNAEPEDIFDALDPVATRMGAVVGTPAYMSPEQASGATAEVGVQSDIYSLGIILYEILTGRTPFRSDDVKTTLESVIAGRYEHPRQIDRSVPAPLASICTKAISHLRENRYASAQQMADDVNRFLAGDKVSVHHESWPERVARLCQRRPALAASVVVATLILAASMATTSLIVSKAHRSERLAKQQAIAAHAEETLTRQAAEQCRQRAHQQLEHALASTDVWLDQLSHTLDYFPGTQSVRRDLLDQAVARYQMILDSLIDQPQQQLESARCMLQIGELKLLADEVSSAQRMFLVADQVLCQMQCTPSQQHCLKRQQASAEIGLLACAVKMNRATDAAIVHLPQTLNGLAESTVDSASDPESMRTLALGYLVLGRAQAGSQSYHAAVGSLEQSLRTASMMADHDRTTSHMHLLSTILSELAAAHQTGGNIIKSVSTLQEHIDRLSEQIQATPERPDWLELRAMAQIRWGHAQRKLGNRWAAEDAYQQALLDLSQAWTILFGKSVLGKQDQVTNDNWPLIAEHCYQHAQAQVSKTGNNGRLFEWLALLDDLRNWKLE